MENRHLNQINDEKKLNILKQLLTSQVLDNFLQTKFGSFKRYGGEGAESMIAFFDEFLKLCSKCKFKFFIYIKEIWYKLQFNYFF